MGCGAETKDLILENLKGCIRGCEEFNYLGVNIPLYWKIRKVALEDVKNLSIWE